MVKYSYTTGIYPHAYCSEPYGNCTSGDSTSEQYIDPHNMILSPCHYRWHLQGRNYIRFLDPFIFGDYLLEMCQILTSRLPLG